MLIGKRQSPVGSSLVDVRQGRRGPPAPGADFRTYNVDRRWGEIVFLDDRGADSRQRSGGPAAPKLDELCFLLAERHLGAFGDSEPDFLVCG